MRLPIYKERDDERMARDSAQDRKRREQEYDAMSEPLSDDLREAWEALEAAMVHNRETFINERFSTVEQAGLALLEDVAIAREALNRATQLLALQLHYSGVSADKTAEVGQVGRATLFRWKKANDERRETIKEAQRKRHPSRQDEWPKGERPPSPDRELVNRTVFPPPRPGQA